MIGIIVQRPIVFRRITVFGGLSSFRRKNNDAHRHAVIIPFLCRRVIMQCRMIHPQLCKCRSLAVVSLRRCKSPISRRCRRFFALDSISNGHPRCYPRLPLIGHHIIVPVAGRVAIFATHHRHRLRLFGCGIRPEDEVVGGNETPFDAEQINDIRIRQLVMIDILINRPSPQ